MNNMYVKQLARHLTDTRYSEESYYLTDDLIATAALEWVIQRLQKALEQSCGNFDGSICDLWYLDSHEACREIMHIIYTFTLDQKYKPQLEPISNWDGSREFTQDEIW